MPHKPKINFSEGVLQRLAQYATSQITKAEMLNYLYSQGMENPEQFLSERERLLSAIKSVVDHYQKGTAPGE